MHYPILTSDLYGFNCTLPLISPSVFSETESVSLRADALEWVFHSTPRAGTSQYHP